MQAGRHTKIVTFERRPKSENAFGERVSSWKPIKTVHARIWPLVGREFTAAMQVQSEISTRITCRWNPELADVTTRDRIRYGNKFFDIASIINVGERNRELQFMCVERSRITE